MIIKIFNKSTRKNFEKSLNKILHTCSRSWRGQLNQRDMRVREHMHMHTFDRGLKKSKCHRYTIIEQEKEKREKKTLVFIRTKLCGIQCYFDVIKKETN
jgi:hypothetical protein